MNPPAVDSAGDAVQVPEKRAHQRIELAAQVRVSPGAMVYIMYTANVSLGGLFLEGEPADHPELEVDCAIDLLIFAIEGLERDVVLTGRIARVDPGTSDRPAGFGVQFDELRAKQLDALLRLMASGRSHRVER